MKSTIYSDRITNTPPRKPITCRSDKGVPSSPLHNGTRAKEIPYYSMLLAIRILRLRSGSFYEVLRERLKDVRSFSNTPAPLSQMIHDGHFQGHPCLEGHFTVYQCRLRLRGWRGSKSSSFLCLWNWFLFSGVLFFSSSFIFELFERWFREWIGGDEKRRGDGC